MQGEATYAEVYDVLYGGDQAFLDAQMAFLTATFPDKIDLLLDAGCGTGRHLLPLTRLGYRMTGLDRSASMLAVADAKLRSERLGCRLVVGDLRSLPFSQAFDGAICLDSPLAFILADGDLTQALYSLSRILRAGGRLVAEVFDYPGTLGEETIQPSFARFRAGWGHVDVHETHRYNSALGIWEMRQAFTVHRGRHAAKRFAVMHRLRIRTADQYAAALEAAGFVIQALLTRFPATGTLVPDEQRLIFVAGR